MTVWDFIDRHTFFICVVLFLILGLIDSMHTNHVNTRGRK